MFELVKGSKIDSKEVEKEDVRDEVMKSCVSLRRKEVKCGGIIWKG